MLNLRKNFGTCTTLALMPLAIIGGCGGNQETEAPLKPAQVEKDLPTPQEFARPPFQKSSDKELATLGQGDKQGNDITGTPYVDLMPVSVIQEAKISPADKDWFIEKKNAISTKQRQQIKAAVAAIENKKQPTTMNIHLQADILEIMEDINAKLKILKERKVISDKEEEGLKEAFGLRGNLRCTTFIDREVSSLSGRSSVSGKTIHYSLNLRDNDLPELKRWVQDSSNPSLKEKLAVKIAERIQKGPKENSNQTIGE